MLTSISTNKTSSLKIQRTMSAPVERVFKAWTDPKLMVKWFGCEECQEVKVTQDFTVGGAYEVHMFIDDGTVVRINGEYKEIIPNQKISYTWNTDMSQFPAVDTLVTVEFRSLGDKTELVMEHTNFAFENSAQGHSVGWSFGIEKLSELVESA